MDDKTKEWGAYWNGEPDDDDIREETKLKLESEKVWDHLMDGDQLWCDDKCSCQKEQEEEEEEEITNEEEEAIVRDIWHAANLVCDDKCSCKKEKDGK